MQRLGEHLATLGAEGPSRRPRWQIALGSAVAAAAIAVSPAGAALADAVEGLIGSEPTTQTLFLGDTPDGRGHSEMQRAYFEARRNQSVVAGDGTTPAGTAYQLILQRDIGPAFGSCAFIGFDGVTAAGGRDTQTCLGKTVAEGFKGATVPIYPTVYRGPVEGGSKIPTPVIIGIAPAEVADVRISYLDETGARVEAQSDSAAVTTELLEQPPADDSASNPLVYGEPDPAYLQPYRLFVGFLPPELDRAGPNASQPALDFDQIEITALDADGSELYSIRMDGRFSGDPAIVSVG